MKNIKVILMILSSLAVLWSPLNTYALGFDKRDEIIGHILLQLPHYAFSLGSSDRRSLCIIGSPTFYSRLSDLNNQKKVFKNVYSSMEDANTGCDYVYAPQFIKARQLLDRGLPQRTLLISSYQSFINEGGPLAIVDDDGKMDIYLNLTAVKNQNFQLSPDLIEMSKRVIQ